MNSILKMIAAGAAATMVALIAPTAAFASCTGDCYDGCYQAFGDEPHGYRYLGCLADCNDMCWPDPQSGI